METVRNDRLLSQLEVAALAEELDAIRESVVSDLGEADARYIRRTVATVRWVAGSSLQASFPPPLYSAPSCSASPRFWRTWRSPIM